jgi:hypothetical protein
MGVYLDTGLHIFDAAFLELEDLVDFLLEVLESSRLHLFCSFRLYVIGDFDLLHVIFISEIHTWFIT